MEHSQTSPRTARRPPAALALLASVAAGGAVLAFRRPVQLYWLPAYLLLLAFPLGRKLMKDRKGPTPERVARVAGPGRS